MYNATTRLYLCYLAIFLASTSIVACSAPHQTTSAPLPIEETQCGTEQFKNIEAQIISGDGQGHGPDIGSGEWQSVIEFKLGLRNNPDVPDRESPAWCDFISNTIENQTTATPSFNCEKAEGSVETSICQSDELATLDNRMTQVYNNALTKTDAHYAPALKAYQRGWVKGRNDCWHANNQHQCIIDQYQQRITELQATFKLVNHTGPVQFVCNGDPTNEVIVTFYESDTPSLIAERGDSTSLMLIAPSASGAKYTGRNESFWEHQGTATIVWGFEAPAMHCVKAE